MRTENDQFRQMEKEYKEVKMTAEQEKLLRNTIEAAKQQHERDLAALEDDSVKGVKTIRRGLYTFRKTVLSLAAAAAVFVAIPNVSVHAAQALGSIPVLGGLVQAVTFRSYQTDDGHNSADVQVPQIEIADAASSAGDTSSAAGSQTVPAATAKKSAAEINQEIKAASDKLVQEFKDNMTKEGHQNVQVSSEVVATTDQYYTLKLICLQTAADSMETDYYYTIDLSTGRRVALKDLFKDGADYKTPIEGNIEQQMKDRNKKDENQIFWTAQERKDNGFDLLSDKTQFYINQQNQLVIAYQQGDVAPMYMGNVEFTIPEDVLQGIRK